MRISSLIIGIQACLTSLLYAGSINAQSISLDVKQASITQVFHSIEKQSNVTFVYNEQELKDIATISIKIKNATIDELLKRLSIQAPVRFKVSGTVIGVIKVDKPKYADTPLKKLSVGEVQSINVWGKVTDEKGLPIPGVNVTVKETGKVAVTDVQGAYRLICEPNSSLLFSFIGFRTKEIFINGRERIDVTMEQQLSSLDEVHVIAYGTTTQRLSTGSISKVNAADIEKQPVANPLAALEGRVPGMVVTQNSGLPGSSFSVQVRGRTSIENTSTPLYLIDGVPFNANSLDEINSSFGLSVGGGITGQSPFNSISPGDIESIEVLKDADATAIYGSRGANGVILITTKKGKAGKTKVSGNFYTGAGAVTRTADYLNTAQYLSMRREAFKNDGITPTAANAPDLFTWDTTRYTNWKKLLIGGTSRVTSIDARITGGNELTQFLVGTNYHRETTVFPGNFSDVRANVHFNLSHSTANKKLLFTLTASFSNDLNALSSADLSGFINTVPNSPLPYDANGKLNFSEGGVSFINPLASTLQPYTANTDNLVSNAQVRYTLLPGLNIKANLGYTNTMLKQDYLVPKSTQDPLLAPVSSAIYGHNSSKTWIIEPQVDYHLQLGKTQVSALAGGSLQQDLIDGQRISATNFSSDQLISSPAAAGTVTASANYNQYRYEALFARISFNHAEKYLLNISGRRDGSSRFGANRMFANFGAIGGAWIFTEENWPKNNIPILSYGKLRASYGITGNDKIGDYNYLDTYVSTSSPYQGTSGLRPSTLSNPDYAWELNRKQEAAIDLGFFKDRILLSVNYYNSRSSNQLVQYNLPGQTGFASILQNFPAVVENKGWEFSLNTVNLKGSGLNWSTAFNLTIAKNTLVDFPGLSTSSYANTYAIGYSLDIRRLLLYQGVDPQTGVYKFNGTNLPGDEVSLNDVTPKFYGALSNTLSYKGLQLDFFFQFVKQEGKNIYGLYRTTSAPGNMINQATFILNRWQKPSDVTEVQKITTTGATNLAYYYFVNYSNGIYSDASFIRLKNASLSYTLPTKFSEKIKAERIRIYVQGQNLLTITKYNGNDPESGSNSPDNLPPLRVITAGLQFTF